MKKQKLDKITDIVKVFVMAGPYAKDDEDVYALLCVICSLHNELYKEVTGKYYDYMFHWYNKTTGSVIEDDLFKGGIK